MKKILTLILIVIIAALIGGIYGAIHDQLTYTISPEYYTKFKFIQFELVDEGPEAHLSNPRLGVAAVGALATWWMGVLIGSVLGLVGLTHANWKTMLRVTLRAFVITMSMAFVIGVIGLIYGRLFLANDPIDSFSNWFIPDNIIDFKSFVTVGSMHNFSYAGGVIGLVAGAIYSLGQKKKQPVLTVI
ncbi:hypothetical protein KB206_11995 [Microvirga sp. STS02]|uniref:hypothetical protein n=1 Tax=Hymenobacter negativus TaxID=2795026 RepID=UPI0018DD4DDA|nr:MULTISPECIES: hypothetical protein [Bacteria]MBH8569610.1 hypothetical protein [Hymenobacter negativus]MBR7209346.1 hypothetical protein [Microvirga sp. STS02]